MKGTWIMANLILQLARILLTGRIADSTMGFEYLYLEVLRDGTLCYPADQPSK